MIALAAECPGCGVSAADLGVEPDLAVVDDRQLCPLCRLGDAWLCTCYDPASMEFGPNHPCAACRRKDLSLTERSN